MNDKSLLRVLPARPLPLVSIVTPSYNQAEFIERTILSLKNQTYPNIEHIIVDAGSTDGALDIIKSYEGTYNMRWVSEPDEGMYDAINKGFRMAKGEIQAYINSDDYYLPWTIETVVREFQDNPDAGALFGDLAYFDEATSKGCIRLFPPFWLGMLQRSGFLAQASVFWRTSMREKMGPFDQRLQFVGDCDYWMRSGSRFQFKHVPEVLAVESIHGATKHAQDPTRLDRELAEVRDRYQKPGRKTSMLKVADFFYRAAFMKYNSLRFAMNWARWNYAKTSPSHWQSFIEEAPFPVSRFRLAMTLLPARSRVFGDGLVRQVALFQPSPASGVSIEKAA